MVAHIRHRPGGATEDIFRNGVEAATAIGFAARNARLRGMSSIGSKLLSIGRVDAEHRAVMGAERLGLVAVAGAIRAQISAIKTARFSRIVATGVAPIAAVARQGIFMRKVAVLSNLLPGSARG